MSEDTNRELHLIQKELQKIVLILGYQAGLFTQVHIQEELRGLGVKDKIQQFPGQS